MEVRNGSIKDYRHHQNKRKELFFFSVMPFMEYEFQGPDGNLVNPDILSHICPSYAAENILMGTFSDIRFESFNMETQYCRFEISLRSILRIDIFSNTFSKEQTSKVITKLLGIGFKQD